MSFGAIDIEVVVVACVDVEMGVVPLRGMKIFVGPLKVQERDFASLH